MPNLNNNNNKTTHPRLQSTVKILQYIEEAYFLNYWSKNLSVYADGFGGNEWLE